MPDFTTVWAIAATIVAAALIILHFCNPFPLIQIPDRGHRLFAVPADKHEAVTEALAYMGLHPFRTFIAGGIRQTLMMDGITVIASGQIRSGISITSNGPKAAAELFRSFLADFQVKTTLVGSPEPELKGKLYIVEFPPEYGLGGVAFRLPGRDMPPPKWV